MFGYLMLEFLKDSKGKINVNLFIKGKNQFFQSAMGGDKSSGFF